MEATPKVTKEKITFLKNEKFISFVSIDKDNINEISISIFLLTKSARQLSKIIVEEKIMNILFNL